MIMLDKKGKFYIQFYHLYIWQISSTLLGTPTKITKVTLNKVQRKNKVICLKFTRISTLTHIFRVNFCVNSFNSFRHCYMKWVKTEMGFVLSPENTLPDSGNAKKIPKMCFFLLFSQIRLTWREIVCLKCRSMKYLLRGVSTFSEKKKNIFLLNRNLSVSDLY